MSERDELRRSLGRVGVWTSSFDRVPATEERAGVAAIEAMGYPAIWVPEGLGSKDVLAHLGLLLAAGERIAVASGIANIWARDAVSAANGARALADAYPGRLVFGLGVGHAPSTEARGFVYDRVLERMADYLGVMDEAPYRAPAPERPAPRLLAALGPRMLALAGERTAGAHTYFVPVEHTARAREALGASPVLAVEQTAVLDADAVRAREIAGTFASHYLALPNYANNLRRLGWEDEDVAGHGSDRLLDAVVVMGDVDSVVERVRAHLDAGADHVCVQVVTEDPGVPLTELERLAPSLLAL